MKTRTIGVVCRWITLALAPLLLVGCIADAASGVTSAVLDKIFEEGPTEIEAEMIAKADVNPDYDGQPSPLVVRMYQLSSPTAFKNAGFFALYDGDVATLGNDMTGREEIELRPGQTLEIEREFAGVLDAEEASDPDIAVVEVLDFLEELGDLSETGRG